MVQCDLVQSFIVLGTLMGLMAGVGLVLFLILVAIVCLEDWWTSCGRSDLVV